MSQADHTDDGRVEDPFGAAERIRRRAEQEATRQSRTLWFYAALSLVPIGVGVLFLNYGRLDRAQVQSDVAEQVRPVQADVTKIATAVEAVKPAIEEVKQLGRLATDIKQVGVLAAELKGAASTLETQGQQLVDLSTRVSTSEERQQQLALLGEQFTAMKSEQVTMLRRVEERQSAIQADLVRLRVQVDKSSLGDPRVPDLLARLTGIEKRVVPLEKERLIMRQPKGVGTVR